MKTSEAPVENATIDDVEELRRRVAELEQAVHERDQAIAERDQTIAALRADLERLRLVDRERQMLVAAVESSLDFIALATLEERVIYVNEAGRKMVGLDDMDHARRTSFSDYMLPEDVDYATKHIHAEVKRTGRWQGDFRVRHFKTGQVIPIHYSVFTITEKSTGELLGLGTVTRDITERKRAEEERMRLKDEIIRVQSAALAERSTPLIPISEEVVVMPLVGAVDGQRAHQVMETLLRGVVAHRAHTVILDVTGVSAVDSSVAEALLRAAKAAGLLGAQAVLTGISPDMAQALTGMGFDFEGTITRATLQSAVAWAIRGEHGGAPRGRLPR